MKKATLNKCNNMESGMFALLMETSASVRSVIKLEGIVIIILFNSDWDPNNDIRSLQKIVFDSKPEHIKVLHLYSCFTVAKKALVIAMRLHLEGVEGKLDSGNKFVKKEGNRVHLTPEPNLRKKRKLHVQGTSHPSAGEKHKNRRIGAVNDAGMRSRNTQEDQCLPDASPNTPSLHQSPYSNPLQMEMDKMQKKREQTMKLQEDMKSLLISQMGKDVDSFGKTYDILLQITEMESAQQQKEFDTASRKVRMQKLLAEVMTLVHDTVGSKEMTKDDVGRSITGIAQSAPNRLSIAPVVNASVSEPVNA
ncbi:hypothetical protein BC332_23009 [Capsicum chinense]|nr:hypothetical protein BC332_23009 [Capsicum chinense]